MSIIESARVLSIIPPMTQLNTPYPSTAYLTGFLRSQQIEAQQTDLALALMLKLFSKDGLLDIRKKIEKIPPKKRSPQVALFDATFDRYFTTITPTIAFLQGHDSTIAHRICSRNFLPEGERFAPLDAYIDDEGGDPLAWAFGALGTQDRARHLGTLYLNDIADVLREAVDPRFEFVRYAESLAMSQPTFDPLAKALAAPTTLVDDYLAELTLASVAQHQPNIVLLSVPFPGAVYAAFRIAQTIRKEYPDMIIALGGGFANTELRELKEPRVFDYFDYVMLDAGERPLLALLDHLKGKRSQQRLVRTFARVDGAVKYINFIEPEVPFGEVGTPTWDGLPLDRYLSLLDMLNPMHRLWSDGRWNKLTVAHGCYWKKCSFCDITLDYISRYETTTAEVLVDRIEAIIAETGQTGFHFVDEAAPPKALKALAEELIRRNVSISWWGNIRFEKTFSPDLCRLLAESGCIAISGGLEVASDRLLALMKKGVSVEQVAKVTQSFTEAGVLVHAYLMYGFPTQTVQDTVDALEYVRQLFDNGCIQSGFFHRFACTVHSPVGKNPEEFGVTLEKLPEISFATNDIGFIDPTGVDHDELGRALNKALYNYMHGIGLDDDVRVWFNGKVPRTTIHKHRLAKALQQY
ncbi:MULTISPECIES: B12-binding domain-containing radical SAM protein [Deefgea]|uniref:Radical SAM protein n=1 Tax=Deefgea chitinilytica TaxID=570276 RepID=A0ABS2CDX6_9NEIS|nr:MULTISPECIES: radical SAM protein [Deefgea]MBM5572277.1 radical SAM protein [Deefgea chitinilytica]MBM9889513.1 radical SAM protein [Deefgea sp. CFH1-16]